MRRFRLRRGKTSETQASARPTGSWIRFYGMAGALLLIGLVAGFYLFFPAAALKDRIEYEIAAQTPAELEMGELSLLFPPALRGRQVAVKTGAPQPLQLELASLTLKPSWSALLGGRPAVAFSSELYGGTAEGTLSRDGSINTRVEQLAFAVPLATGSALAAAGVVGEGRFSGAWPVAPETETSLSLSVGQARITGMESVGAARDSLALGTIILQGSGRGKSLKIDRLETVGGDLKATGTGTLILAEPLDRSRINLSLTLLPAPNLDPALAELLDLFVKPGRDGTYRIRLSGTLASPRMH